jgi:hypothetical protein
MNNIYRIENDGHQFKWLGLEVHDIIDMMPEEYSLKELHRFNYFNLSLANGWNNVNSTFRPNFDRPDDPIPDISLWLGYASLVFSERAFEVLGDMLKGFGEFLPIACNGDTFHIFNCRTLANADESRSKQIIFDGQAVGAEKIAFDDKDVNGKTVFKSKYNACVDLYCDESFKNEVEKYAFKGLVFSTELVPSFD